MRLYDIPRGAKLRLNVGKEGVEFKDELVTFHRPDGLYSYCTVDAWPEGDNVVHLSMLASLDMGDDKVWSLSESQEKDETDLPTKDPR